MRARPRPKRYVRKLAAREQKRTEVIDPHGPDLRPHQVILRPLVTEKSTHLSTRSERVGARRHEEGEQPVGSSYTFEVARHATKSQIKAAVQELFGVRVEKVNTQQHLGKKRRYRFRIGQLSHWKKAIVRLHPEDKIEFF
jgi:large subunit ribosomal protein L23